MFILIETSATISVLTGKHKWSKISTVWALPAAAGNPRLMNTLVLSLKTGVASALPSAAVARSLIGFGCVVVVQYSGHKGEIYNILWALVFGFATLNILGLVARRFEPNRSRLSFGELMALMVVLLSITLLGWELLNLLHIFPIRLRPH